MKPFHKFDPLIFEFQFEQQEGIIDKILTNFFFFLTIIGNHLNLNHFTNFIFRYVLQYIVVQYTLFIDLFPDTKSDILFR